MIEDTWENRIRMRDFVFTLEKFGIPIDSFLNMPYERMFEMFKEKVDFEQDRTN